MHIRLEKFLITLWLVVTLSTCFSLKSQAATLGVYQGNGCDGVSQLQNFTDWLGREPGFVLDFFSSDSWQEMLDDATWTMKCWKAQHMNVVFSVPMLPKGLNAVTDGAAGKFDSHFRSLAQLMVANGYGNAIIRLGWEFNGGWYSWAAKSHPQDWVKYWQHIVTAMRSVQGAAFRFDWCPATGTQQIAATTVYPGDSFVDFIGSDVYNQTWSANVVTPEQRWQELLTQSYGLNWLSDFAKQHGKPISIPEWATGFRPDGHGGGDDPYFVSHMASWIKSHNVNYHGYWDYVASDYNGKLSSGNQPHAASQYLQSFKSIPQAPMNVYTIKK